MSNVRELSVSNLRNSFSPLSTLCPIICMISRSNSIVPELVRVAWRNGELNVKKQSMHALQQYKRMTK